MTKDLIDLITNFLFGDKSLYNNADPRLQELLEIYVQDKNSSTIREFITLNHLGIEKLPKKHGPDGYDNIRNKFVEVKPVYGYSNEKNDEVKIGAGGSFNDLDEFKLEEKKDWDLICSGFADNKCIYIIRFPLNVIASHLKEKLLENRTKLVKKRDGSFKPLSRPGTVKFGHNQFKDSSEWEIMYLDVDYKKYLADAFLEIIEKKLNDKSVP